MTVRVEPAVERFRIAGLILQPLVENALKHGVPDGEGLLQLTVTAELHGRVLRIDVGNLGTLGTMPMSEGVGLTNVRRRLDTTGQRGHLALLDRDGWVHAVIDIEEPADAGTDR